MNEQNKKVPTVRFKGFTNDWEQRKLGEIAERILRKNSDLQSLLPLTISAQDGLVDQTIYFNKQVASKQLKNYLLLYNGDFAYNKSYSVGYPYGTIKRLDKYKQGVLSTLYIAFKPTNINSDFLQHYYDTDKWYREIYRNAAEGARNHGLLNISANDFFNSKLITPSDNDEQLKIAKIINLFNRLITLQQRKLDLLKQLKKGLLQKMFADKDSKRPILRFNGFTDDWEYRKLKNFSKIFIGLVTTMTKHYSSKGTFLIRNSNISENHISHQDPIFLDKDFAEENKNRRFRINDVVTVHTGDIGTSAVISEAEEGAIGFATIATRLNTNYLYPLFVSDYLNTDAHKAWARRMSTGDGRNNYNLADFKRIIIPSPQEIKEQEIIANIIAKIEIEIFCCQKGLRSLEQLKQGLLQQMFI